MTINDAPCAHLRSCKGKQRHDEALVCVLCIQRCEAGDLWACSPDGRRTCLYVLVVRYIYGSSVQALDLPGAATTRRRRAVPKSHNLTVLVVVNLLLKVI